MCCPPSGPAPMPKRMPTRLPTNFSDHKSSCRAFLATGSSPKVSAHRKSVSRRRPALWISVVATCAAALFLLSHSATLADCTALPTKLLEQEKQIGCPVGCTTAAVPPSPSPKPTSPTPANHLAKRLLWLLPPFPRLRDEAGDPIIVVRRPTSTTATPTRRNGYSTATRSGTTSTQTSSRFINEIPTRTRRLGQPTETDTKGAGDPVAPMESSSVIARQRERALLPPIDPPDPVDPVDSSNSGEAPSIVITKSMANAHVTANLSPPQPRSTSTDSERRNPVPVERMRPVLPPTIVTRPSIPSATLPSILSTTATFVGVPIGPPPQVPDANSTAGASDAEPAPTSPPVPPSPPEPAFQPNVCGNGRCEIGEFCSACPGDCSFQQTVHRPIMIEKVSARVFSKSSGFGYVSGLTRNGPGYFGWSWRDLGNFAHRQKGASGWQGPEARQGVLVPCWAPHIHQFASRPTETVPRGVSSMTTNSTKTLTPVVLAVVSAGLTKQWPSPLTRFVDYVANSMSPLARAFIFLDLHQLLSPEAHLYRPTIKYAADAGHTIGIRLTAGAPPSLAQLTTALCVYAHLPEWLAASDSSDSSLHALQAPFCQHPPNHIHPSTLPSGWSPILHLTLPLPALFPGLPEEFAAALVALGRHRVRLVHPSFFVQEDVTRANFANPEVSVAKLVQDLFNVHVGVPGWVIGLDLRADDKLGGHWNLTKVALDTVNANGEVVSDPVSAIVADSADGFPVGSNSTLSVTPRANGGSPLGIPFSELTHAGPSLAEAARTIAERLPRAIQSVGWALDSDVPFLVQETWDA